MFTNNAVMYDVWNDETSDCQIKYVKSQGHLTSSGTMLAWNTFNFMLFLTLKEFRRSTPSNWLVYEATPTPHVPLFPYVELIYAH